jgi:hypothetical protein
VTCPQCAFENPPAMAFCGGCGTRLASLCPSCRFANPEGFAFCGKCGARVAEAPAPTLQGSPAFASPRSYTPKHLAEKILTSKAALEGERKQVTVLFADLKGSMELLADRDPEEARKILDPVLERMMDAVHHYEGTVNQVMGDGIMALFGAPLAHEDHAVRACYAALRMQDGVCRYSEELRRAQGVEVQIRVVATSFLGRTHASRGEFSDAASFLERNVALEGGLRYERFGSPAIQSALSGAWLARRALRARPVRRGHRAGRGRRADR